MKTKLKYIFSYSVMPALMMLISSQAKAQGVAAEKLSVWTSGAGILMVSTIVILMAVILIMGKIVKTLVEEDTIETAKKMKANKGLLALAILLVTVLPASAQDAVAAASDGVTMMFDMEATVFWMLLGVIMFEFIVLLVLCYILYTFLVRKGLIKAFTAETALPKWMQWNAMMGNDIPLEKDAELLTDHDYDGIQELDNGMPPFLKYMFVATILFAVYYVVDYHVIKASPLQLAEYERQLEKGEADKLEYLKKAGASVDENSVTLLEDASMLDVGARIYTTNCIACHGDKGQGGVGPNLTDNYWIHGGDVKSVFKSIKYGIPEKGMRAWQSEIKPGDMQAVSSYILKNLTGTNVAGGKEPQGDLYDPNAVNTESANTDSIQNTSDTTTTK